MIEIILVLLLSGFVMWNSFTFEKKRNTLIKKKRYFTKPDELGVYYEEDENGKITKFQDGQHY